ncbi:hypothetical protein PR048_025211 [Dryococelus australis]|uniref:Uncharacterized protein n=1 Tax=Dryococelus australis TaxID=614101 RepID=A0ABQ9GQT0_9NEOP|nr:hypothetical protein PR048_025211 [Dryococelus australis]
MERWIKRNGGKKKEQWTKKNGGRTIPTCQNSGVSRTGIELGSLWWEASSITTKPQMPLAHGEKLYRPKESPSISDSPERDFQRRPYHFIGRESVAKTNMDASVVALRVSVGEVNWQAKKRRKITKYKVGRLEPGAQMALDVKYKVGRLEPGAQMALDVRDKVGRLEPGAQMALDVKYKVGRLEPGAQMALDVRYKVGRLEPGAQMALDVKYKVGRLEPGAQMALDVRYKVGRLEPGAQMALDVKYKVGRLEPGAQMALDVRDKVGRLEPGAQMALDNISLHSFQSPYTTPNHHPNPADHRHPPPTPHHSPYSTPTTINEQQSILSVDSDVKEDGGRLRATTSSIRVPEGTQTGFNPLQDHPWIFARQTIPLVGGFSRRSPVYPALSFRRCSILSSVTLIGSQDSAITHVCSSALSHVGRLRGELPALRSNANESSRPMPLDDGFSRGSSASPGLSFRRCSILISITPIGSQDLAVKSHLDLFTIHCKNKRCEANASAKLYRKHYTTHVLNHSVHFKRERNPIYNQLHAFHPCPLAAVDATLRIRTFLPFSRHCDGQERRRPVAWPTPTSPSRDSSPTRLSSSSTTPTCAAAPSSPTCGFSPAACAPISESLIHSCNLRWRWGPRRAQRLERLPSTKVNRARYPGGGRSRTFAQWESCQTMPLPSPMHSGAAARSPQCRVVRCCDTHNVSLMPSLSAVAERLECSPPSLANRVLSPAGSHPGFRKWKSCRMMPLVGWFSWGSPVYPPRHFIPALLHSRLISPSLKTDFRVTLGISNVSTSDEESTTFVSRISITHESFNPYTYNDDIGLVCFITSEETLYGLYPFCDWLPIVLGTELVSDWLLHAAKVSRLTVLFYRLARLVNPVRLPTFADTSNMFTNRQAEISGWGKICDDRVGKEEFRSHKSSLGMLVVVTVVVENCLLEPRRQRRHMTVSSMIL